MPRKTTDLKAPKDSLIWRVVDYLSANPGERLTRSDVAKKFDADAAAIDGELAPAVASGHLIREPHDEDGIIWRLRYRGAKFPAPFTGTLAAAQRAVKTRRHTLIDVSMFEIEKGVPLVEPAVRRNRWNELFGRMEPGDSFQVPDSARMALSHAQANYRKTQAQHVRFAIRKVSETHTRIWRTS